MQIIMDMNTQNGLLEDYDAESILPNINKILYHADDIGLMTLGTVRNLNASEDYLSKHPMTIINRDDNIYYVLDNGFGVDTRLTETSMATYFEYSGYDIFSKNEGQPGVFTTVLRHLDVTEVFVFGLVANIDVWNMCIGLLERGCRVNFIYDASIAVKLDSEIYPDTMDIMKEQLLGLGSHKLPTSVLSTEEFLKLE